MKTDVFCKRLNGYAKRNKKFTTEIPFFSLLKRKTVPLWSKYEGFPSVGEGSGTKKIFFGEAQKRKYVPNA